MTGRLVKSKHSNPITISLPYHLLQQLEILIGDVTRSKYIQRLIEEHLTLMNMHMDNPILST